MRKQEKSCNYYIDNNDLNTSLSYCIKHGTTLYFKKHKQLDMATILGNILFHVKEEKKPIYYEEKKTITRKSNQNKKYHSIYCKF